MGIIDFILNLAGLLLWLNWRSLRFDPLAKRTPATLMGTLRPASPEKLRRWHLLLFIAALLLGRALLYRWVGPMFTWVAKLDLGVVILPFRSDSFAKIFTFSCFSFGLALATLYAWLLLLSLLKGPDPLHRLVKIPLGRVDDWPAGVKVVLPWVVSALVWWPVSWLCVWLQVIPATVSAGHRFWESFVLGLTSYLSWTIPLYAILLLYLLSSYIYFGLHPLWHYNSILARKILAPLKALPLRIGRVDLAPALAIVIIFFASKYTLIGLTRLFAH